MDWLNLHISTIDSPEATVCDPVRRATWVWLLRFCIGQENGGRIAGCGTWGDTTWQQMAKVRLREVRAESTLWRWDGADLIVHFYPAEKEAEVQAKRALARSNGNRGGRPRKTDVGSSSVSEGEPMSVQSAKTEGNGKERNMEGEGEEEEEGRAIQRGCPWIRTSSRDKDRQRDNLAALDALYARYGRQHVERTAERLAFTKGKLYPDDKDLLAALFRNSEEDLGYSRDDAKRALCPHPEGSPERAAWLTERGVKP